MIKIDNQERVCFRNDIKFIYVSFIKNYNGFLTIDTMKQKKLVESLCRDVSMNMIIGSKFIDNTKVNVTFKNFS